MQVKNKKELKNKKKLRRVYKAKINEICRMYMRIIKDTRVQCDITYPLVEILIIIMCAVIAGIDEIEKIPEFATSKKRLFKKMFNIAELPSLSTYRRALASIDAEMFSLAVIKIIKELIPEKLRQHISIDGKTVKSTAKMDGYEQSLHIVTAWVSDIGISIGQLAIPDKTNEIPCVKDLLGYLDIKGSILTLDAMHCQKETVSVIVERGGDYLIGLKGNQPDLYTQVDEMFQDLLNSKKKVDTETYVKYKETEKNRGRFETRICYVLKDIVWLDIRTKWKGLETIFAIKRITEEKGKITEEISYYITSIKEEPSKLIEHTRKHWSVESMHWQLDMVFNEDRCRVIDKQCQQNLNVLRKAAISIHKNYKEKTGNKKSISGNMFKCLINEGFLEEVLLSVG